MVTALLSYLSYSGYSFYQHSQAKIRALDKNKSDLNKIIKQINTDLKDLQSQDQFLINKDLQKDIENIETTYKKAVTVYERLLELKQVTKKTDLFDSGFAGVLTLLSERIELASSLGIEFVRRFN